MVEKPVKMKKKDQISLDEELAFKLQAEEEEEDRLVRQREEEANIVAWDNVQAMIDADYQMAQQMQAEEQEKLSIEEKSKLFVQLLKARKKHFAKLFDKAMKRVNTFVDMDTKLVEGSESIKKKKVDEDKETAELQRLIEVVLEKEEVAIDAIPFGNKLKPSKYGSTRPVEDLDLVLYGDLKTMFDPYVENQVSKNQSDYRVLDWKLYDSCGVHSLRKQNVHIHMLVEKRSPLTPATITNMLNRKLQADHWNEMCYQLLKLITK
ncbi:hypothetical protein Tco_0484222 [Tanacetum coccineum]